MTSLDDRNDDVDECRAPDTEYRSLTVRRLLIELAAGNISSRVLREVGLRGAVKSLYYSWQFAGKPVAFVLGKGASVSISSDARVDVSSPFVFGAKNTPHVDQRLGGSRLRIDESATFQITANDHAHVGAGSILWIGGSFEMGDSFINGECRVSCAEHISIGNGCAIAWDVELLDNDGGHTLRVDGEVRPESAPIVIQDDVWIGHHATVQKGVTIGEGAVVASHSLVNEDVPPRTLVAGVPASVIKEDVEWAR